MKLLNKALIFLSVATFSNACFMLPLDYKGSIGQKTQEAIIFHQNNIENLTLKIKYKIEDNTTPEKFAWIITVPNEPTKYSLSKDILFEEMFNLSEKTLKPISKGRSLGNILSQDSIEGVSLGERVKIGNYDIQPVKGVGPDALKGLNAWLSKKGFPEEKEDHMRYFIDNNFTFLCITISPNKGTKLQSSGKLKPLSLSFKSKDIYYPLLFSSRQGVFDVNMYILSDKELGYAKNVNTLNKIKWSNKNFKRNIIIKKEDLPTEMKKIIGKSNLKNLYFNNLKGNKVNTPPYEIKNWHKDVFFKTK